MNKKLKTRADGTPYESVERSYNGSQGVTFSCQAKTIRQIEEWIASADLVMYGAKANRSDVLAIMVGALVAAGWRPGLTVQVSTLMPE